ncbi:ATP-binding protein [Candidatus Woesearchaeota archaeon]|nr:ATP-binding protein [Candidatus Woesearchaeota archaeon]MBW3006407.1 ATP-binding protein [Candidatus Woesearchaeota archaeon]
MISNLVLTNAYVAIVELVANAYDADANNVKIVYNPDHPDGGLLKITDDGLGMTPEDLVPFYRLGDSPKLEERVSPGGRVCIGKFGVGTITLHSLAERYELVTRKNGLETRVVEEFKGRTLKSTEEVPHTAVKTDPKAQGTEITMHGLRFGEDTDFKAGRLRRRIQLDLPVLPDFHVSVNDEDVKTLSITNATKFVIDKHWKHLGHLYGAIYLAGRATHMAGMHIYVNGRRVGDPQSLMMHLQQRGIAKCIVGILHANDLESAISFDRTKFSEDHKGYRQLHDAVSQALAKVAQYYRVRSVTSRQDKIRESMDFFLGKLKKRCIDANLEEVQRTTTVELTTTLPRRTIGVYNPGKNIVLLNENHAALFIGPGQTKAQYEAALLHAFVDMLAEHRIGAKKQISCRNFLEEKEKIWRQINKIDSDIALQERIHPMIFYDWKDIAKITGKSEDELQYLKARNVLPREAEGAVGQAYLDLVKKTEGMISLYSLMADIQGALCNWEIDCVSFGFLKAGKLAQPFVKNIGTRKKPCIFIERACVKDITELIEDEEFENNAKARMQELHDKYFTVPQLAKRLGEDIDIQQVSRVLDYARKSSIEIRQQGEKGVKFNYADFLTAMQLMRKSR